MAKIEFKGLGEYMEKLNTLSSLLEEQIIGSAVYDGAAIVADAMKKELLAIPTDESHDKKTKKRGPSKADLDAVIQGMGVASMQNDNGFLNVKIGFDGYDDRPTKKYPQGHPVVMLARAINSGTSFMEPNAFAKSATRKSRKQAEAAMKKKAEKEISKIMMKDISLPTFTRNIGGKVITFKPK